MYLLPRAIYIAILDYALAHATYLDAAATFNAFPAMSNKIRYIEAEGVLDKKKSKLQGMLPEGVLIGEVIENFGRILEETYDKDLEAEKTDSKRN